MVTRRQFLRAAAVAAVATPPTLGLYAWRVEPHWLEIVHRELPLFGLPKDLEGRTLVQISDIHVGPQVDDDYVIHSLERAAALDPDYVVFTGDFLSRRPGRPHTDQLTHVLRSMPHGRRATVAILGNHDYGVNWSEPSIAAAVAETVRQAGAQVLRNESVIVAGLQLIGFDDLWAHQFSIAPLQTIDREAATVALVHNPDCVDLPGWQTGHGWVLAGHTHGGQCKPPFLPPPILPVQNRRYTAGEFDLPSGRRLYINRGVGHLIRVRFNCRPEITAFRLTRAGVDVVGR
jgi:hypothetical protein